MCVVNSKFTKQNKTKLWVKIIFSVILTLLIGMLSTYGQNCNEGFKPSQTVVGELNVMEVTLVVIVMLILVQLFQTD